MKRYSIILEWPSGARREICHVDVNPEAVARVVQSKNSLAHVSIRDNQPQEEMPKPGERKKAASVPRRQLSPETMLEKMTLRLLRVASRRRRKPAASLQNRRRSLPP